MPLGKPRGFLYFCHSTFFLEKEIILFGKWIDSIIG